MVPDPEVATPLPLWASQEKVLVLFKPGWKNEMTHACEVGTSGIFLKPEILAQHAESDIILM